MAKRIILEAEEQKALRDSAKAELVRMENVLRDAERIELLDKFKNTFNICETVYKVILERWKQNNGKSTGSNQLKLDMRQVPHALVFAGYQFDKSLLQRLFGADNHSAKKLRDAVTHGISEKASDEINTRQHELFSDMRAFMDTIRDFDNE